MTSSLRPDRVVFLHVDAPRKPREGEPCNGCGVCCLAEPCPVGIVATRSRRGPCAALRWDTDASMYRCGLLAQQRDDDRLSIVFGRAWRSIARRWIGAGRGCDCSLEVDDGPAADQAAAGTTRASA